MENAPEVLVIILSVFLAIFLLLGIIVCVLIIKLTKTLKHLAEKADGIVTNVESASVALKNVAGPLATGKFLVNIVENVLKHKKRKG